MKKFEYLQIGAQLKGAGLTGEILMGAYTASISEYALPRFKGVKTVGELLCLLGEERWDLKTHQTHQVLNSAHIYTLAREKQ